MIWHPAVRADADRGDAKRLFHDPMEGIIILLSPEDLHSSNAAIEYMENHPSRRDSCSSRHGQNLTKTSCLFQYMRLSPFVLFKAAFCLPSSERFVTSTSVGIATRPGRPLPGQDFHPLEQQTFSRRTWTTTLTLNTHLLIICFVVEYPLRTSNGILHSINQIYFLSFIYTISPNIISKSAYFLMLSRSFLISNVYMYTSPARTLT
jgi:hypothetical protein